ncbi:MAG: KEOPS complex subunit Cgi121 [Candidatus Micrarchaeota archaeon]
MLIVRGESGLAAEELLRRAIEKRIVLLDAGKVGSLEELELAYVLAKKSLGDGSAISKKMEIEFVLWLAGKKDIRRAFEEAGWKKGELIAVAFGMGKKELLAELELKERKLETGNWKLGAGWEAVERISLSRIS